MYPHELIPCPACAGWPCVNEPLPLSSGAYQGVRCRQCLRWWTFEVFEHLVAVQRPGGDIPSIYFG